MKKIVPVILLTSLFWIVIYLLISHKSDDKSKEDALQDYSEAIIGKWEPVEMSELELTFSKYGTMRMGDLALDLNYSVANNRVHVSLFGLLDSDFEIKIYTENNDTFLEIFDEPQFAGKYIKVNSTPQQEVVTDKELHNSDSAEQGCVDKTTEDNHTQQATRQVQKSAPQKVEHENPNNSSPVVIEDEDNVATTDSGIEQPSATQPQAEKAVEQSPTQQIGNTVSITGVWVPIEGAEYSLTITKYGTVIQHINSVVNSRYKYSLSGNKLKIGYDNNAKASLYAENGKQYLEIYNSERFSGKYRLSSKAINVAGDIINPSEYQSEIVGKWKPVFGAEYPIEVSKYGTVIQNINSAVNSRYEYSINNSNLKIGYDGNATVSIIKNATGIYLEIYNSERFSGLYKKQ